MHLSKLKNNTWVQLFVIYSRYALGGTFAFASLIKIKGLRFTTESGADNPIPSAWHFFETLYQSGLYWKFIGLSQLIAAGLLMTQRYSKLGTIVFLPIMLNVFIITISYNFNYTPVVTGSMLACNILLLYWHSDELRSLINKPIIPISHQRLENSWVWEVTGLTIFLFTFIYRLFFDHYNLIFWVFVCINIGLMGLITGLTLHLKKS